MKKLVFCLLIIGQIASLKAQSEPGSSSSAPQRRLIPYNAVPHGERTRAISQTVFGGILSALERSQYFDDYSEQADNIDVLVLNENGVEKVIGFIVYKDKFEAHNKSIRIVEYLVIDPAYQRQGHATFLLQEFEKQARQDPRIKSLRGTANMSISTLYEKFGAKIPLGSRFYQKQLD